MADEKPADKDTPKPQDEKKVDEKPGDGKVDDKKSEVTEPKKEDEKKPESVLGGDLEPAKKDDKEPPKKDEPKPVDYSSVKLGDDSPFAESDRDLVIVEAKELGLTAEQAQKLLGHRERAIVEYRGQLRTQLQNDPELGGRNMEETIRLARRGRDHLFPRGTLARDAMLDLLEHSGMGDHPEWVRAFVRIGRDLDEDKTLDHKDVGDSKKPPLEKRLYKQPA